MKAYSVLEMRSQRLIAVGLVAVLLLAFVGLPQAFAETSGAGAYENISVDAAYNMIKKAQVSLVLDVRNQSEYNLGHLYGAVLIPVYELEERISELQGHMNDPIIVYCKSGYRSQIACEILVNHGFTRVYNMLGGITAWMEAGYPIYTTYHYVTVGIVDEEILLQIDPLLLHQTGCTSCGCQSCPKNQTCTNTNAPSNITVTTIEQDENTTITLITYEVNDITYEVTVTQTLLWSYNELTDEINRTASFVSTEIAAEEMSMQFYSLSYMVQHEEYNLTLYTMLTPLDFETYNSSFTIMNYAPAGKSELVSLEFVEFNSSVTLSQQYAVLGKVAKEVGKVYEKSGDENLAQLAQSYYVMQEEAKYLSKLVEKQLQQYNKGILDSSAILMDDWLTCAVCTGVVGTICWLLASGVAEWAACHVVCTIVCVAWGFGAWLCFIVCETVCNSVLYWMLAFGIFT
ncbi:MAG: rhodanese-like domain-containing protein, partial [Candidatus Bathyarchaeia archaeon]